ncbi:MAG: rhomboid family intramembrane serine protease [Algicola sp.]|nr:rhomboid family intramembrane serine protease [Algicola sp.]
MSRDETLKFTNGVVVFPMLFVLIIWVVFWIEIRFGVDFTTLGIYPQRISGLKGILFSPFIHSNITHLYHNTLPLFILSAALFYFYRDIAWKVILLGILFSGAITWSIGRPSYHIGASGLIYVLASFTFFKGVFAKYYRLIALSLLVVFLYGSMLWYVFPVKENMSWEGHLAGLLVGVVFALVFKKHIPAPKKYAWEEPHFNEEDDPFLKHFDKDGNFIEQRPEEDDGAVENAPPKINYIYKEDQD